MCFEELFFDHRCLKIAPPHTTFSFPMIIMMNMDEQKHRLQRVKQHVLNSRNALAISVGGYLQSMANHVISELENVLVQSSQVRIFRHRDTYPQCTFSSSDLNITPKILPPLRLKLIYYGLLFPFKVP